MRRYFGGSGSRGAILPIDERGGWSRSSNSPWIWEQRLAVGKRWPPGGVYEQTRDRAGGVKPWRHRGWGRDQLACAAHEPGQVAVGPHRRGAHRGGSGQSLPSDRNRHTRDSASWAAPTWFSGGPERRQTHAFDPADRRKSPACQRIARDVLWGVGWTPRWTTRDLACPRRRPRLPF